MLNPHFKDAAQTLLIAAGNAGVTLDTYAILNLTDALISMGANFTEPEPVEDEPDYSTHEGRIEAALNTHEVMHELASGRKIHAIKALRAVTLCGLKEAKDAVESSLVTTATALYSDPWSIHHDRNEPPF